MLVNSCSSKGKNLRVQTGKITSDFVKTFRVIVFYEPL